MDCGEHPGLKNLNGLRRYLHGKRKFGEGRMATIREHKHEKPSMAYVLPRLLAGRRFLNSQAIVFAVIATPLLFFLFPSTTASAGLRANIIIAETNALRTAAGARALTSDILLTAAAQRRAEEITATQQFAHTRPNGFPFATAASDTGYAYERVAENLAMNFFDESHIRSAWEQSASHRENLFGDYTHIGIGVASGSINGTPTMVVVQLVGRPIAP